MTAPTPDDLRVETLGECRYESPLAKAPGVKFTDDANRVRYQQEIGPGIADLGDLAFEKAGPRARGSSSTRRGRPRRSSPAAASARG